MKKIAISVIIPCFNVELYLSKCLDSVLNNTFSNFEVIIIDDGSSDSTKEILKSYAKKDSRIKAFYQENMGQAKTRNKAINKSLGEYLFFLDSDDYIDHDLLEKLYKKAKQGYDIVLSNAKRIEDNNILPNPTWINYSDDDIKNYILNGTGPAWKLIKKDIIVKNNLYFYENHIYEDIAVVPSFGIYAKKIGYVDDTNYYYLIHKGSTMNQTKYSKKLEDIFYSLDYLSHNFNGLYKEEVEYIYIEHLLHAASLRFFKFRKYDMLDKVVKVMHDKYPFWRKNKYYKKRNIKYKIVCNLFYMKQYKLLNIVLKK